MVFIYDVDFVKAITYINICLVFSCAILFCLTVTVFTCACVCMCVCVHMCVCNLSSRRGVASINLMTSVCRAYPALHPLAPVKDAQPIKLAGQVLRIISINCNITYVFIGICVFALNCSCNLYVPMMT